MWSLREARGRFEVDDRVDHVKAGSYGRDLFLRQDHPEFLKAVELKVGSSQTPKRYDC